MCLSGYSNIDHPHRKPSSAMALTDDSRMPALALLSGDKRTSAGSTKPRSQKLKLGQAAAKLRLRDTVGLSAEPFFGVDVM
jgi:hypothetical protein